MGTWTSSVEICQSNNKFTLAQVPSYGQKCIVTGNICQTHLSSAIIMVSFTLIYSTYTP